MCWLSTGGWLKVWTNDNEEGYIRTRRGRSTTIKRTVRFVDDSPPPKTRYVIYDAFPSDSNKATVGGGRSVGEALRTGRISEDDEYTWEYVPATGDERMVVPLKSALKKTQVSSLPFSLLPFSSFHLLGGEVPLVELLQHQRHLMTPPHFTSST